MIPIARQYPGAREFVEAYRKEFPGADLSYHSAAATAGARCWWRPSSRPAPWTASACATPFSRWTSNTVYGAFKVDQDGLQIAHKMLMFQWQDGKKAIVWPEELSPGKPRFPTPPWSQR